MIPIEVVTASLWANQTVVLWARIQSGTGV